MIKCKSCNNEISPRATTCPKCGHPNNNIHLSARQVIASIVLGGCLIWFLAGGGFEKQASNQMQKIHNQVADDAVSRYEIAKREGNKIQVCVQAGFVSAAYLQAKDETNYQQWKQIEIADCKKAGINR